MKLNRLFLFVLLLLLPAASLAQERGADDSHVLVERTAVGGQVTLLTPQGFGPMSDEMLAVKYPSSRRPTEVLTNERGSVNIAFNHTQNALPPEKVADFHSALEGMLKNLYPSARWSLSEVVTRDGQKFVVLDFWTPAVDTEVRNLMLGASVEGRLLLISFNVTRDLEPEWGPVGERIIDSVRLRP